MCCLSPQWRQSVGAFGDTVSWLPADVVEGDRTLPPGQERCFGAKLSNTILRIQKSEGRLSSFSSQLTAKSPLFLQASSTCSWPWLCHCQGPALAVLHRWAMVSIYRCCLSLFGSLQGSSALKAKARSIFIVLAPGLIPWVRRLFCSMELLILEEPQHFIVVWGTGAKRQFISIGVGEESIHLFPFYCPCLCSTAHCLQPRVWQGWLQQPVGSRGFVSVRMLTRSSKLPHKHKHQRAGMCVFWSSFLGFTGL